MNKKYLSLIELVTGIFLAFLIINLFFTQKKQFENLDLGSETSVYYAQQGKYPIHLSNATLKDFTQLYEGWELRGRKDVILVLGNSQTHAINQLKEGEVNYPQVLSNKFKDSFDVLTHSIPNANLQEFYMLYAFWMSRFPVKKIIVPVFIDDLREDGIREEYARIPAESHFLLRGSSEVDKKVNSQLKIFAREENAGATTNPDMKALHRTVQEKSETYLNKKLQENFPSWNYRETVRGDLFTFMYKLRNTILRINPQTKRSLIPALKQENLNALREICQDAHRKGIEVYIYIPPVRYDVEPPYYVEEYNASIEEVKQIAAAFGNTKFKKLDTIVEGKYWGTKDPTAFFRGREYDFMHFQYPGHTTLADSLYAFINSGK